MTARPSQGWSATAKVLHWATAVLVLAQVPLGRVAASLPLSPRKLDLFVWHKSLGFVVLALALARLVHRALVPAPPLPVAMGPWPRHAARASHAMLYALLVAMPVSGWIVSSASNVPFQVFRAIPVPAIAPPDPRLAETFSGVHGVLAWLLVGVVLVHVAGALWHGFVQRDDVLARMLPWRRRER